MGGRGGQLQCEGPVLLRPRAAIENTWLQSTTVSLLSLSGGGGGGQDGKKGARPAERAAWPLRECRRKEESVAGAERGHEGVWGARGHQQVLCPDEDEDEEGTCSSLLRHT